LNLFKLSNRWRHSVKKIANGWLQVGAIAISTHRLSLETTHARGSRSRHDQTRVAPALLPVLASLTKETLRTGKSVPVPHKSEMHFDPAALPGVMAPAVILGIVSAATKMLTGYQAAARTGAGRHGRLRAGVVLIARGEFSIVIAGLGAAAEPRLGPLAAAYVLFLAVLGPALARVVK
jgi:hypothetical protein